jgi:hypothetical protein
MRSTKKHKVYECSASPSVVVAAGWCDRTTRIHCRRDAALVDGDRARMAWSRRTANWTNYHVHDPAGIIHLRHACNIFIRHCLGRRSVSSFRNTQWHSVFSGRARFLFDRSIRRNAVVVGPGRYIWMRGLWRCAVVAEPEKNLAKLVKCRFRAYSFDLSMNMAIFEKRSPLRVFRLNRIVARFRETLSARSTYSLIIQQSRPAV